MKALEIPVEKLILLSCAAQHQSTFSKNSYYVFLIHSLLGEAFPIAKTVIECYLQKMGFYLHFIMHIDVLGSGTVSGKGMKFVK